jgi:Domain of unknown function (DUF4383)
MAKTICLILGIGFILVGLIGFVSDNFLGTHLSLTHNLIHLISGAVALYLGLKGTLSAAKMFCLVFGAVYLLLGVVGFLFNSGTSTGLPPNLVDGGTNTHMLHVIPGNLELGMMDHVVHILLGLIFLVGAFLTKTDVRAGERV